MPRPPWMQGEDPRSKLHNTLCSSVGLAVNEEAVLVPLQVLGLSFLSCFIRQLVAQQLVPKGRRGGWVVQQTWPSIKLVRLDMFSPTYHPIPSRLGHGTSPHPRELIARELLEYRWLADHPYNPFIIADELHRPGCTGKELGHCSSSHCLSTRSRLRQPSPDWSRGNCNGVALRSREDCCPSGPGQLRVERPGAGPIRENKVLSLVEIQAALKLRFTMVGWRWLPYSGVYRQPKPG